MGLGYPVLNRYDPRETGGLSDTRHYAGILEEGPGHSGRNSYRILQPLLGRPIEYLVRGRLGSWNATFFALLCVCSMFAAATGTIQFSMALRCGLEPATALLSCGLFLLNFAVPNSMLAGMVDASEAMFLLLTALALSYHRWLALPFLAALGALGKETYMVLGCAGGSRFVCKFGEGKGWQALVATLGMEQPVCSVLLRSVVDRTLLIPWQFAAEQASGRGLLTG